MADEKRLTVRLPMRMYSAVVDRARRDGVSVNALIVQLIGMMTGTPDQKRRRPIRESDRRRHPGDAGGGER